MSPNMHTLMHWSYMLDKPQALCTLPTKGQSFDPPVEAPLRLCSSPELSGCSRRGVQFRDVPIDT